MRDEVFIRGKIPMTKSEVRAVCLSKLELKKDSVVYDIGAGTGSVSVEAALAAESGHVYAVERTKEGCELIAANAGRFGVRNLTVAAGSAPEALRGLPAPDRVFIGGSGGNLTEILDELFRMDCSLKIVLTAIALETLETALRYGKMHDLPLEVVQMSIAKAEKTGPYHMMKGQNPIYIMTFN